MEMHITIWQPGKNIIHCSLWLVGNVWKRGQGIMVGCCQISLFLSTCCPSLSDRINKIIK